ncbi:MAG: hypothetical protein LUD83_03125 [Clostridiales bacterium]|nr:hypothetical protein [Clostridiales bacterium]
MLSSSSSTRTTPLSPAGSVSAMSPVKVTATVCPCRSSSKVSSVPRHSSAASSAEKEKLPRKLMLLTSRPVTVRLL